jgi:hypothetical protein
MYLKLGGSSEAARVHHISWRRGGNRVIVLDFGSLFTPSPSLVFPFVSSEWSRAWAIVPDQGSVESTIR